MVLSVISFLGGAAIFALIEWLEDRMRFRWPGRNDRIYAIWKLLWGLPLILLCAGILAFFRQPVDPIAVLAGVAVAAVIALMFFREKKGEPDETG